MNIGGNIEAVEICLRNGGSIDDQQDDLSTPVHLASSQGSLELLNLMFTCQPQLISKVTRMTDVQGMTPLHKYNYLLFIFFSLKCKLLFKGQL
jgi:ankyrin repeat protein